MVAASALPLSSSGREPVLRDRFAGLFHIGTAFGSSLFKEEGRPTLGLISRQFDSTSPENTLKWKLFEPEPGAYDHEPADAYVEFGTTNGMYVVGHVLFWHNQTPEWVFQNAEGGTSTREQLLALMRQRVRHVAERYGDRIQAWDVVNEAILDDGTLRQSDWTKIIGDDFIEQAFRIADEELPKSVELFYNDYGMTGDKKRDAVVRLIGDLRSQGLRIDGVGMQGHWSITGPSVEQIEDSIVAFANAGVDVHITELDIDVLPRHPEMWSGNADVGLRLQQDPELNPYRDGLPSDRQKELAERYADIFRLFITHSDKIKRVTFWGPTDRYSWLNNWPIRGRTNHALLFDRDGKPKGAFHAVMELPGHND
jgi:endo-1,4-beta-xylanase